MNTPPDTPATKRGRGQPPKPPGERTIVLTVRLAEKVIDWLSEADSARNEIKRLVMEAYDQRQK
jgi:CxxC motif-containing protein (DUF1111 family)